MARAMGGETRPLAHKINAAKKRIFVAMVFDWTEISARAGRAWTAARKARAGERSRNRIAPNLVRAKCISHIGAPDVARWEGESAGFVLERGEFRITLRVGNGPR